ncbi:MAG: hypothetical protein ACRC5T_03840, partial [Cetobacterium sp.]
DAVVELERLAIKDIRKNEFELITVPTEYSVLKEFENEMYDSEEYYNKKKLELENTDLYKVVKDLEIEIKERKKIVLEQLAKIEKLMIFNDKKVINFGTIKITLKCNKSSEVAILDASSVPEQYIRVKSEIDKRMALKDLRDGLYIEGLELRDTENYKLNIENVDVFKCIKF